MTTSDYLGSPKAIFRVFSNAKIFCEKIKNIKNVEITSFVKNGFFC